MKKRQNNKKAVSPVVSTTLLIVIVVILAIIIFLWARGFIQERISKFDKPIESVCNDVNFRASLEGDKLLLVNRGNVPIYAINIKKISKGTAIIEEKIVELDKGDSKNETISVGTATEIIIIPVLLGESGNQKKAYPCAESTGVEIVI